MRVYGGRVAQESPGAMESGLLNTEGLHFWYPHRDQHSLMACEVFFQPGTGMAPFCNGDRSLPQPPVILEA